MEGTASEAKALFVRAQTPEILLKTTTITMFKNMCKNKPEESRIKGKFVFYKPTVLGTMSALRRITMRPADLFPIVMSMYTCGLLPRVLLPVSAFWKTIVIILT